MSPGTLLRVLALSVLSFLPALSAQAQQIVTFSFTAQAPGSDVAGYAANQAYTFHVALAPEGTFAPNEFSGFEVDMNIWNQSPSGTPALYSGVTGAVTGSFTGTPPCMRWLQSSPPVAAR